MKSKRAGNVVKLLSTNGCFRLQARLLADFQVRDSALVDFLKGAAMSKYISSARKERSGGMAVLARISKRRSRARSPYGLGLRGMDFGGQMHGISMIDYGFPPRALVLESGHRGGGHYYLFQMKKIPQGMYFDNGEREAALGWTSAPLLKGIPKSKPNSITTGVFLISEEGIRLTRVSSQGKSFALRVGEGKYEVRYSIGSEYAKSIRKSMRSRGRGRPYLYICRGKFGGIIWENEM